MEVFPKWATYLDLGAVDIKGIDLAVHDSRQNYREAVAFIKSDPLSLGALVTTHKLDLYAACLDLFDEIDLFAKMMAETSCLSKRDGKLICHAKDPISAGLTLNGFLPDEHFANSSADLFSIGAGGSTIALSWHLAQASRGHNRPGRLFISNRSQPRLDHIKRFHDSLGHAIPVEYVLAPNATDNDAVLTQLRPGSLIVNATGLGKDAPGSPLTDAGEFPQHALVWELNYRGDLKFLDQARSQGHSKSLQIEDGWRYFIHGWTRVIAEVFDVEIPTSGPMFDQISTIAATTRTAVRDDG
jgi:shikimate 5-dehydrogenase